MTTVAHVDEDGNAVILADVFFSRENHDIAKIKCNGKVVFELDLKKHWEENPDEEDITSDEIHELFRQKMFPVGAKRHKENEQKYGFGVPSYSQGNGSGYATI